MSQESPSLNTNPILTNAGSNPPNNDDVIKNTDEIIKEISEIFDSVAQTGFEASPEHSLQSKVVPETPLTPDTEDTEDIPPPLMQIKKKLVSFNNGEEERKKIKIDNE
jgi:hypothetical protein